MNALRMEKKAAVISALVEGNSIRSIERMFGTHRDTVMRLLVNTGNRCQTILNQRMRGVQAERLEFDEIWTYVGKKDQRIRPEDPAFLGSQFVFVAIDPETKLVPTFTVGKRTAETTWEFCQDVRERVMGRPQITSDGFRPYLTAIDGAFGMDVDYAYLVKSYGPAPAKEYHATYHPPKMVAIFHQDVFGEPKPWNISTSIVERQNLTMRMQIRRFTRLTNAFSKKLENLKAALYLHFAWYNFVRVHGSLRVTPAMAAGLVSEVWPITSLLA